jgi:4-amino-4-deoxy-L-arabinose transferase-like glycosyltransferase
MAPSTAARKTPWAMACGLLCLLAAYALCMNLFRPFDRDELEAVHTAWKILHGEVIYVDFAQHHHPLLYVCLAPVIGLLGERATTVIACRIAMLPFFCGIIAATWLLALRLFDKRTALVAVACLLLSWPLLCTATEIRPDVPEAMLGMFALVLLYPPSTGQAAEPPKQRPIGNLPGGRCLLIGLCLGLSFLFLQKAVFYVAAVTLIFLVRIFRRESGWKDLFTLGGGFMMAILPLGAWLIARGMLRDYFFWNWTVNACFRDRFSFLLLAKLVLKKQPVICVFGLLGFVDLSLQRRHRRLAAIVVVTFGTVLFARCPYLQYWMPVLPLLAIYAAHGMVRTLGSRPALLWGVLAASAAAMAITEPLWPGGTTNARQLEQIDYVLQVAGPADAVYDGCAAFNVFRPDVDYFWFSLSDNGLLGTCRELGHYDFNVYDRIDTMKPKVVNTYGIENLGDARIHDHYEASQSYPALLLRTR